MVRNQDSDATDPSLESVLEALASEDCRALVAEMVEPRTAAELSEASDVPLSTTYRKLDQLTEASLVEEAIEIRSDGRHTSRYYPDFAAVEVALQEDRTMDFQITRPPRTADERIAELWTAVRREV